MEGLYKMNFACGRNGDLTGLFIAKDTLVKCLIDHKIRVYFGEVLGKHSEIWGYLDEREIKLVTQDPKVLEVVKDFDLESGFNPFSYTFIKFDWDKYGFEEEDDMLTEEICTKIIEKNEKL